MQAWSENFWQKNTGQIREICESLPKPWLQRDSALFEAITQRERERERERDGSEFWGAEWEYIGREKKRGLGFVEGHIRTVIGQRSGSLF